MTGSSTTTDGDATQAVPQPAQPITELVSTLDGFGGKADCADAVKVLHPADLPDLEGGADAANCKALHTFIDALNVFKASDSAEFGTAALIDGTNGDMEVSKIAVLDETKSFKLLGIYAQKPQIGTDARPDADFEAPAAKFVQAMRDDDCKSAHAALSPISRLAEGNAKRFCSTFEDMYMTDPASLGPRLQADPEADLIDLGGTRNEHFFGLATEPAGYRTIVVGTTKDGVPLISDVLPVER
jgi:hypothetical protein